MLEAVQIRDPERVYTLYPHEVSGGMGQRVMIAMMLIAEPDLLIADEPTSALDVTVQVQVLAILDELVAQRGMGLIFISHDLNLVSSFCDRVLVMYAGQVRGDLRGRRTRRGASIPIRAACSPPCPGSASAGRSCRSCSAIPPGWPTSHDRARRRHHRLRHAAPRAVTAVRDLTLAVAEGEAFGLVGESGSGKSTVLRAVAGLIPYASGEITLAASGSTGAAPRRSAR